MKSFEYLADRQIDREHLGCIEILTDLIIGRIIWDQLWLFKQFLKE